MGRIIALLLGVILTFYASSRELSANEGTIPEPVLPLMFHDVAFTTQAEAVSVQLGLSDWGNGS
jgi:hypothetical protein